MSLLINYALWTTLLPSLALPVAQGVIAVSVAVTMMTRLIAIRHIATQNRSNRGRVDGIRNNGAGAATR